MSDNKVIVYDNDFGVVLRSWKLGMGARLRRKETMIELFSEKWGIIS